MHAREFKYVRRDDGEKPPAGCQPRSHIEALVVDPCARRLEPAGSKGFANSSIESCDRRRPGPWLIDHVRKCDLAPASERIVDAGYDDERLFEQDVLIEIIFGDYSR